jgi:hypothetical protein
MSVGNGLAVGKMLGQFESSIDVKHVTVQALGMQLEELFDDAPIPVWMFLDCSSGQKQMHKNAHCILVCMMRSHLKALLLRCLKNRAKLAFFARFWYNKQS